VHLPPSNCRGSPQLLAAKVPTALPTGSGPCSHVPVVSRQVAEQKERERKREKEKREAEAARRLKAAGDAAARRRDKAAHADAVANFRTLLQVGTAQDGPAPSAEFCTRLAPYRVLATHHQRHTLHQSAEVQVPPHVSLAVSAPFTHS
jgi:hypothetical protein